MLTTVTKRLESKDLDRLAEDINTLRFQLLFTYGDPLELEDFISEHGDNLLLNIQTLANNFTKSDLSVQYQQQLLAQLPDITAAISRLDANATTAFKTLEKMKHFLSIIQVEIESSVKIKQIEKECRTYKIHLHDTLYALTIALMEAHKKPMYTMFENPARAFTPEDITRLRNFIFESANDIKILQDPQFQKLGTLLNKYIIVSNLSFMLNEQTTNPCRSIINFKIYLDEHRTELSQHLNSKTTRFLAALAHILTFGLLYKAENDVFGFKAAKGQVMIEKVDQIIRKHASNPLLKLLAK